MTRRRSWILALVLALTALFAVTMPVAQAGESQLKITGEWSTDDGKSWSFFGTGTPLVGHTPTDGKDLQVRFVCTFPNVGSGKSLEVTLGDGMRWIGDNSALSEGAIKPVDPVEGELVLDDVTGKKVSVGNGKTTYDISDSTMTVTLVATFRNNRLDDITDQANAVTATLKMGDLSTDLPPFV